MTIQQAFDLALQHHQAGRLADAETLYRKILAVQPGHADTLCLLGVIAQQVGRNEVAVDLIGKAIALAPKTFAYHNNLGNALKGNGQLDEAIAAFRQAITLQPNFPEAHSNLGVALSDKGQVEEAIAAFRQAITLRPDYPEAHVNLGAALQARGRLDEAIAVCRRAIILQPTYPKTYNNLGNALQKKGLLDEAIAAYRQGIALDPNYPEAHSNLGIALKDTGRMDEAIVAMRQAIAFKPDYPEVYNNLGVALRETRQLDEAIAACRQAIALKPNYPAAFYNLGNVLNDNAQFDEAIAGYQRAVELKPDFAEAHNNLGNAFKNTGRLDAAIASFHRAMTFGSHDSSFHSNLLYTLHFHPACDAISIREEHRRWNERFAEPLRKFHLTQANDRDPERRLKVGYVSPNFWKHVVGHFLTPLLEAHDHERFEIYCYASVKRPDEGTERMRKTADVWRDALRLRDDALAERIREDKIDILVDLTQHMADSRMLVFARKPAPVQVAWLGYPGSTGLAAMDYRLTDARMEPEGSAWSESIETPIRLPDSWFCFDPIDEYPEPGALPALRAGHITFGSLNDFCKVNESVLDLWAAVLQAVDGSRLLLKCPVGESQTRVREWFKAHGIPAHRLDLVSRTATRAEFLQLFERIDIALDPFPYNGGTTTCEALWMGVPVPTFPGSTVVSRIGMSILHAVGLPELVATSPADYAQMLATLAADLPRLAALRFTLRHRMKTSAFMDAGRFARNVEQAYQEMWRQCVRKDEL